MLATAPFSAQHQSAPVLAQILAPNTCRWELKRTEAAGVGRTRDLS